MSLHNPPAGCGCVWAAYAGLARILCFRFAFFSFLFRGLRGVVTFAIIHFSFYPSGCFSPSPRQISFFLLFLIYPAMSFLAAFQARLRYGPSLVGQIIRTGEGPADPDIGVSLLLVSASVLVSSFDSNVVLLHRGGESLLVCPPPLLSYSFLLSHLRPRENPLSTQSQHVKKKGPSNPSAILPERFSPPPLFVPPRPITARSSLA